MQAIDVSYAILTAAKARALRSRHGIELFIQDLWTGGAPLAHAQRNLEIAAAAGLEIAAYVALAGAGRGGVHIDNGQAQLSDELWRRLRFVAVDVELAGIPNRAVRQAVERVEALGQRAIIYTSSSAWVEKQGNPTDFRHLPLWNASWGGKQITFVRPYGGWTKSNVIGRQHTGDTQLQGLTVDINTFDRVKVLLFPNIDADSLLGGDAMWIVTVKGTRKNYITNGIARRFIPTRRVREELQRNGMLPKKIVEISNETMNALKLVE